MHVLLVTLDEVLAAGVTAELAAAGHTIERWHVGESRHLMGKVAVVDGLNAVSALHEAEPGLPLLAVIEAREIERLPHGIGSFALKPLVSGEIAQRCAFLRARLTRDATRERLLSKAVEAANDIIEITDATATLQFVNPAYERVLGVSAEEAVGKTPAQLVRSDLHDKAFWGEIDRSLSKVGGSWRGVIISRARDGRLVHLESTISAVSDADNEVTHHVGVKRDITARLAREAELRRANSALERARDRALDASRAKSEFLANMSHELRTPLNAILGYSEMLIEEAEVDGVASFIQDLQRIHGAGEHLLRLINDVLDISKIEAGRMELCVEAFELSRFLEGVIATVTPLVADRGNTLEVDIEGLEDADYNDDPSKSSTGRTLMQADELKLKQALLNLLSNANKFTDKGSITMRARLEHLEGRGWLRVDVEDTGIGISEQQVRRLFQPFVQADASTTRKYGGTGLGLAISKRFCEMMGGTITVQSEPGQGSTFSLTVPQQVVEIDETTGLSRTPTPARGVTPANALHRVVVIDDDPAVQDVLLRSLSSNGFSVECTGSGPEGIARVRELRPDAVILDVLMPGMDGWTVLGQLKADELTADIPVIMLTMIDQRRQGIALGAADYLIKPVHRPHLLRVLQRCVARPAARVLIVEDDDNTRALLRRTLERLGHAVVEASDGADALGQLEGGLEPDLVLLDLMMPVMDGFTFLSRIRADARWRGLEVVVVTAREFGPGEREDLERATYSIIEKGSKSRDQLVSVVRQWINQRLRVE